MKILVAESDTSLRSLLVSSLRGWGHKVVTVEAGRKAWESIVQHHPDIALLDWAMPRLDGINLCRRIRKEENLSYIYIIMLTSGERHQDILAGFSAGMDDYIVRPFNKDIFRCRVSVGARVAQYDKELTGKNEELRTQIAKIEKLAEERSKQLVHAERMATVGLLSAGIAHEINNPTAFIAGNIQTLERFCEDLEPLLREQISAQGENTHKMEFILEETPKIIGGIRNGVTRISHIVRGLKGFCCKNENLEAACDINTCIKQALDLCHNALKYHITVEQNLAEALPYIKADPQQIDQVLVNLFVNAADAMKDHFKGENERGILSIETKSVENTVLVTVGDTGPGIPENKLNDIWKPFFTTKPPDRGTGLGLFTVNGLDESHDGRIEVNNKSSGGAEFTITFPMAS